MPLTQALPCDGISLVSVHSAQRTVVLTLCLCGYCMIRSQGAVEKQVCWQGPGSCCCCYGLPCYRVTRHVGSDTDGAYVHTLVLGPCILDKRCTPSLPLQPAGILTSVRVLPLSTFSVSTHWRPLMGFSLEVWNANFPARG